MSPAKKKKTGKTTSRKKAAARKRQTSSTTQRKTKKASSSSPAKKTASRSSNSKASGAKKTTARKANAKKTSTRKASAKKSTTSKTKKAASKKTASKKAASKKRASKKVAAKASTAKKAPAKKAVAKKSTAKKSQAKASPKASASPPTATDQAAGIAPTTEAASASKKPSRAPQQSKSRVKETAVQPVDLPVEERPTEELWTLYRQSREKLKTRKTDANKAELESLRNILMERHYPLVKYIAERLLQTLPKSIELDDLISAGLFGLMDAIRGFDPERGIKFKTYCTTRIRGSILDQLRSQDWVPRLVRLKASRIDKALQRLTGEYGREPTHAELAQALDLDHVELSKEMTGAHAKSMYSLSDKWEDRDDDSSMEKVDVLEDKKAIDPIGELNRNDMMLFITRSLTHKERFIIEQYYQVGHTMREIGEMLALTESRVCQIHSNVMGRLKSLFGQKQTAMLM